MRVMCIADAVDRIRMDYAEMPGLHLTFWQAQRLWNLSEDVCQHALSQLVACGLLVRTRDGAYRARHAERTSEFVPHSSGERAAAD